MVLINPEFRISSVFLTCALAFIGSYASVSICEQYRIATFSTTPEKRYKLLIPIAICFGGVTVWGVFYMGTSSFRLFTPEGKLINKSYNIALTTISALLVSLSMAVGVFISSTDSCFAKSKVQILDECIDSERKKNPTLQKEPYTF